MSEEETALEPSQPLTPAGLMEMAIARGLTPEGLQIMAATYERLQAKHAEMEFARALTAFQASCPAIPKNSTGVHNSRYAKLSDIVELVKPALLSSGLAFSFDTEITEKSVRTTCILRHAGGHQTRTPFECPVDLSSKMAPMHATASATSFAERYAFCLALGIVTGMPDDDGKAAVNEPISPGQVQHLTKLIEETRANTPAFWTFAGVPMMGLDQLPAKDFDRVQAALIQRKTAQKKGGQG